MFAGVVQIVGECGDGKARKATRSGPPCRSLKMLFSMQEDCKWEREEKRRVVER